MTRRATRTPAGRGGSPSHRVALVVAEELAERRVHAAAGPQDQIRDEPRPAGLVSCAEAGAVVAVEVFVEDDVVAPPRVVLEPLDPAETGPAAVAAHEERDETLRQGRLDLGERQLASGSRRVLDAKGILEAACVATEGLDDEVVDRHPD